MTLTDLADVAVPKQSHDRWYLKETFCGLCGFDAITIEHNQVACASCHSRICVLCGRFDERVDIRSANEDWETHYASNISWILPGVCSTHEGDPRLARLAIPATPEASLTLLN